MATRKCLVGLAAAALLLSLSAGQAWAARVRYHYVPGPGGGGFVLADAGGAPGERLTWRMTWEPYNCPPPRITCVASFRHPCTGQSINVPLGLPPDTPRMEYRGDRTIYDYGSYTVSVVFLPDGTVSVVYDSGLLRAP